MRYGLFCICSLLIQVTKVRHAFSFYSFVTVLIASIYSTNVFAHEDPMVDTLEANTSYLSNTIPLSSIGPIDSNHINKCFDSFKETRARVRDSSTQSVVVLSNPGGIAPFITLQSVGANGRHYTLWQTLNGEIKGYALRDGEGFDYNDSTMTALPLSWHPTFIWDSLFASDKSLNSFSCIFMGRTRVMGKRVSILRLMPQENLRYSYLLAKEDESDFPVELTILDPKGSVIERMTTMDSRSVTSLNFPINDEIFNRFQAEHSQDKANSSTQEGSTGAVKGSLSNVNSDKAAEAQNNEDPLPWPELQIPNVYQLVDSGKFAQGGPNCTYQEFSDGITSFRVYKNDPSAVLYPVLTNGTISVVRKKALKYEYSVVGEVPVSLAEYVLTRING